MIIQSLSVLVRFSIASKIVFNGQYSYSNQPHFPIFRVSVRTVTMMKNTSSVSSAHAAIRASLLLD